MPSFFEQKVASGIRALGGDPAIVASRGLPQYADAETLVIADVSQSGFRHKLTPHAASQWELMKASARDEDVSLILLSGFRSFDRQFEIIRRRVDTGESISNLFCVLAPPGCSQHHTGRALDIGTLDCEPASLAFSKTPAFAWLKANAGRFGFGLSYPENNSYGYFYEPWHWFLAESCD